MEVHHHPHVEKKRFKEYFLEFLMIFLAVTLGFFAENIREHYLERSRAGELAQSLIKDFQSDTSKLNWTITMRRNMLSENNTLLAELKEASGKQDVGMIQVLAAKISRPWYYLPFNGTYEQIKNSGSLRYFSPVISGRLTTYEQNNKQIEFAQNLEKDYFNSTISPFLFTKLNMRYIESLNNKEMYNGSQGFKRNDPFIMDDLYTVGTYFKSSTEFIIYILNMQKDEALKNINLLQKEYRL